MHSSGQLKSYLGRQAASDMDCERVKREAWRADGDLVLMHDQIAALPLADRNAIAQIAMRVYGVKIIKGNFK